MALIVYPTTNYDSFISVANANTVISKNTLFDTQWTALTDTQKEVYLRIATTRILNVIDITLLDGTDACLVNSTALMAVRDLVFELSSAINPNTGLVSREKAGDVEVSYYHGNSNRQVSGRSTNPYPNEIIPCLTSYGADINTTGIARATLVHS